MAIAVCSGSNAELGFLHCGMDRRMGSSTGMVCLRTLSSSSLPPAMPTRLQAEVRGEELELAVPERAAQLDFDGVETEGVGKVSMTALARGDAKGCGCRKQCGPKCPCKKRKSPCHRGCGCKCKTGANCSNY